MTNPTNSPSHSEPDPQTQNPISPPQNPQSPQTLTLETPQNHPIDQFENDPPLIDQDNQDPDHQFSLSSPVIRRSSKRKKGPLNKKKQQAIQKKVQTLIKTLNPIPFVPAKKLDFDKHEELLKRLGLWEFVHIEFDKRVRTDLIAQLIANYEPKKRYSYVNGYRIFLNRTALGRALNLPVRREKGGSGGGEPVVLDLETYDGEVTGFIENFLSNWVLLHGELWSMPDDLMSWTREIKDGNLEKVDWAGLVWFMVEKELSQGVRLEDCYYASHLQYLIKSEKKEVFDEDEPEVEVIEEEGAGVDKTIGVDGDSVVIEEPNVELTLGSENVEKQEAKEVVKDEETMEGDTMVVEEIKDDDVARADWVFDGGNSTGAHFLQRCSTIEDTVIGGDEESKDDVAQGDWVKEEMAMDADESKSDEECERTFVGGEEDEMKLEEEDLGDEEEEDEMKLEEEDLGDEEEEDEEECRLTPNIHGMRSDGFEGNLLQELDTDHISYGMNRQFDDQSHMSIISPRLEPYSSMGGPSFCGNGKKREISCDHDLGGGNKRLRTDGSSSKSSDFDFCMDQIQLCVGKARDMYEVKEKDVEQLSKNQQILINEVQQRDNMIEHLHKMKYEELHKKDEEIYRLDRELFVMGNLINGYRDALKATQKDFSEYRDRCQLPEEPIYRDVGPGGLVLSTMEIERQRLKREEEDRVNRVIIEQNMKQFEEECVFTLEGYFSRVQMMDTKLLNLEKEVSQIKEVSAKGKVSEAVDPATPVE